MTTLIGRLFHVRYTLRGTSYLLHRIGYTPQVPVHRAAERDEAAIAAWRDATWVEASRLAAATGAYLCFEDEAGQTLRPPKARTWAPPRPHPRGRGVRQGLRAGVGSGDDLLPARCPQPVLLPDPRPHAAAKASAARCPKPTTQPWSPPRTHQLHAPVILCWDNLNTHVSAVMRTLHRSAPGLADRRPAARVCPELNPVEGAWSNMKNSLGNLASGTPHQLAAIIKNRLKRIQYRPALIDGFLAQTGLSLEPEPP